MTDRIHRLTHLISYRIYGRYVQAKDKKEYLVETLNEYKDLTNKKPTE